MTQKRPGAGELCRHTWAKSRGIIARGLRRLRRFSYVFFLTLKLKVAGVASVPAGATASTAKVCLPGLSLVGLRRGAGREGALVELALEGRAGDVGAEAELDLGLALAGLDRLLRVRAEGGVRKPMPSGAAGRHRVGDGLAGGAFVPIHGFDREGVLAGRRGVERGPARHRSRAGDDRDDFRASSCNEAVTACPWVKARPVDGDAISIVGGFVNSIVDTRGRPRKGFREPPGGTREKPPPPPPPPNAAAAAAAAAAEEAATSAAAAVGAGFSGAPAPPRPRSPISPEPKQPMPPAPPSPENPGLPPALPPAASPPSSPAAPPAPPILHCPCRRRRRHRRRRSAWCPGATGGSRRGADVGGAAPATTAAGRPAAIEPARAAFGLRFAVAADLDEERLPRVHAGGPVRRPPKTRQPHRSRSPAFASDRRRA